MNPDTATAAEMSSSNLDRPGLPRLGLIGLGIMGSLYANHLLNAGYAVTGYDVSVDSCTRFSQAGGEVCRSATDVVDCVDIVITALSSVDAFCSVMTDGDAATRRARPGQVFIETGTLPIQLKEQARDIVLSHGASMIDAPVTGTRIHAERKALTVYASGDPDTVSKVTQVLESFANNVQYVGPFGAGMKMKIVTNHLVAVHNVAAAEALCLAKSAGLDLKQVYDLIAGGPASSAIFDFRGPLMINGAFENPTMRSDVFQKDLNVIDAFSKSTNTMTPVFDATLPIYRAAVSQGMASKDVSAVFTVLCTMSGFESTPFTQQEEER